MFLDEEIVEAGSDAEVVAEEVVEEVAAPEAE